MPHFETFVVSIVFLFVANVSFAFTNRTRKERKELSKEHVTVGQYYQALLSKDIVSIIRHYIELPLLIFNVVFIVYCYTNNLSSRIWGILLIVLIIYDLGYAFRALMKYNQHNPYEPLADPDLPEFKFAYALEIVITILLSLFFIYTLLLHYEIVPFIIP